MNGNDNNFTQLTSGNFESEADSAKFFDKNINQNFFIIEKEVTGRRIFDDKPSKSADGQNLRVDRILHPTHLATKNGWKFGPIAIEIKKSNIALGGIIAQIIEQRQSIYLSKHIPNYRIFPLIFAIFPCGNVSGDVHSLIITQNILICDYNKYNKEIRFTTSSCNVLSISTSSDSISVSKNWMPSSKKGHRGLQK